MNEGIDNRINVLAKPSIPDWIRNIRLQEDLAEADDATGNEERAEHRRNKIIPMMIACLLALFFIKKR